jgi:hypothetical protein
MLAGCSAPAAEGQLIRTDEQVANKPAPVVDDPWLAFQGEHVPLGKVFRVQNKPTAIDGVRMMVTLAKVDWQTMDAPGGVIKIATANLRVQRGDDERGVTLEKGETKTALGVKLTLVDAGDSYDPSRSRYNTWVDLKAEAGD